MPATVGSGLGSYGLDLLNHMLPQIYFSPSHRNSHLSASVHTQCSKNNTRILSLHTSCGRERNQVFELECIPLCGGGGVCLLEGVGCYVTFVHSCLSMCILVLIILPAAPDSYVLY